jgi:hypothetical protein
MTRFALPAVAALAITLILPLPTPTSAAESEPLDLEPNHQAMVARHRIKDRTGPRQGVNRNMADDGDGAGNSRNRNQDCGSVDIGNSNSNDRSARNRVNPREQTVIVTGPVINTARCR